MQLKKHHIRKSPTYDTKVAEFRAQPGAIRRQMEDFNQEKNTHGFTKPRSRRRGRIPNPPKFSGLTPRERDRLNEARPKGGKMPSRQEYNETHSVSALTRPIGQNW